MGVGVVVPEAPGNAPRGLRTLVLARSRDGLAGEVRVALNGGPPLSGDGKHSVPKVAPRLDPALSVTLEVAAGDQQFHQLDAVLPAAVAERVKPGEHGEFVVYATQNVELSAFVVVPLRSAMPPPAPKPWKR